MIIGLVGPSGVGKTSVAEILETVDFIHYSDSYLQKGQENKEDEKIKKKNLFSKIFSSIENKFYPYRGVEFNQEIFDKNKKYLIEPINSLSLVSKLKSMDELYLIYVHADLNIRYKRYKQKIPKESAKEIFSWETFQNIRIHKNVLREINYKINNNSWCDLSQIENPLVNNIFEILAEIEIKQEIRSKSQ